MILFYLISIIVFGVLLNLLFQSILFRLFPLVSGQKLTFISAMFGYLILFGIIFLFDLRNFFVLFSLVYFLSAYTYFHFFNMSETARRIRLLYKIYLGEVKESQDFSNIYNEREMISVRLFRLISLGQAEYKENKYFSKGIVFYMIGRMIYFITLILNHPWPEIFSQKK